MKQPVYWMHPELYLELTRLLMEALKCWKCRHGHIYDFSDCGGGRIVDCDHPIADKDMEFDTMDMMPYPDCYEEGTPYMEKEDED